MRIHKNDIEPISTDILRNKNYAEPSVFNRQIFCTSPEGKTKYLSAKSPEFAFRPLMVIWWIIQKNKKRALLNNF